MGRLPSNINNPLLIRNKYNKTHGSLFLSYNSTRAFACYSLYWSEKELNQL